MRRVSYARRKEEDEIPLVSLEEPTGELDTITESEMAGKSVCDESAPAQVQILLLLLTPIKLCAVMSQESGEPLSPLGQVVLDKPPESDETSVQLARRLRAALRTGQDMSEYRDLNTIRPSSPVTQAQ